MWNLLQAVCRRCGSVLPTAAVRTRGIARAKTEMIVQIGSARLEAASDARRQIEQVVDVLHLQIAPAGFGFDRAQRRPES